MIDLRFRPLAKPPYRSRKASSFKAKWGDTLDKLEKELRYLGARDIIVQAGFELQEIRNDGWPRGGARAVHPAVVISFRDNAGNPLSFPCDTYDNYEDNMRAIALSLEALRAVNRYGVTKGHEQYKGFTALPPGDPIGKREAALKFLSQVTGKTTGEVAADPEAAYRAAAQRLHPDSETGSHDKFVQLQQHREALRTN